MLKERTAPTTVQTVTIENRNLPEVPATEVSELFAEKYPEVLLLLEKIEGFERDMLEVHRQDELRDLAGGGVTSELIALLINTLLTPALDEAPYIKETERNGSGQYTSVKYSNGKSYFFTYNPDGTVDTKSDGRTTWKANYSGDFFSHWNII